MARRKGTGQIQKATSGKVTPATVPTDKVQLNDVEAASTPAAQVTGRVQGAIDEGVNTADMVSATVAQSYATRLGQNMPVVLGNMTQVTSAVFSGLTDAMAEACDVQPVHHELGSHDSDYAITEGE